MPRLLAQDQIIATITVDIDGDVVGITAGLASVATYCKVDESVALAFQADVYITEKMLMEMNGFVRAKWQNAFKDAARGRDTNPLTPDQSF